MLTKNQIKKAFETGEKIEVEGYAKTKFIEIYNSEYNADIIESNKNFENIDCVTYDENMNILSISMSIKAFL